MDGPQRHVWTVGFALVVNLLGDVAILFKITPRRHLWYLEWFLYSSPYGGVLRGHLFQVWRSRELHWFNWWNDAWGISSRPPRASNRCLQRSQTQTRTKFPIQMWTDGVLLHFVGPFEGTVGRFMFAVTWMRFRKEIFTLLERTTESMETLDTTKNHISKCRAKVGDWTNTWPPLSNKW